MDKGKTQRLINEITNKERKKGNKVDFLIDKNGERIDKVDEIASCFNRYFSTVGKTMAAEFKRDKTGVLKDLLSI